MSRPVRPRKLVLYQRADGTEPLTRWLGSLRDNRTRLRIERRIQRVALGNLGDHQSVGEGVQELRLHFGAGYRVYFAEEGDVIVVLLCGGDKRSQRDDIARAKHFWRDYLEDQSTAST